MNEPRDQATRGHHLSGYGLLRRDRLRALVRHGYEAQIERLASAARGEGAETDAEVQGGRAPHALLELGDGDHVVVRRYRRGGAMRHLNRSTYFLGHRAFHEVAVTAAAARAGVRVPLAIAGLEWRGRLGYSAALVTRYLRDAQELAGWLLSSPDEERNAVLRAVGEQIGTMHAGGIAHPDLNLRNLLVQQSGDGRPLVYIIDFDRGTTFSRPVPASRGARDLRRLHRSALKLQAPVSDAGWQALRDGYGAAWPLPGRLG